MSARPKNRVEVITHLLRTGFPQVASWMQMHPRVKIEADIPQPSESQLAAFQIYASKLRGMSDSELFVEKQLHEAAAMATRANPDGPDLVKWQVKGLDKDERTYWAKTLAEWDEVERQFREGSAESPQSMPEAKPSAESDLRAARNRIRELEERAVLVVREYEDALMLARRRIEDLQVALTESIGGLARIEEQRDKDRRTAQRRQSETIHPKLRTTFEKLVLGMAVDKFKYQPGVNGSTAENIRSALLRAGIRLDVKTVRDRLTDAGRRFQEGGWE